jgi:hypothetical protein
MLQNITKQNAGVTMCSHEFCSNKPAYFDKIHYHNFMVFIVLCEEHYQEIIHDKTTICPAALGFCPSHKVGFDIICPEAETCPATKQWAKNWKL